MCLVNVQAWLKQQQPLIVSTSSEHRQLGGKVGWVSSVSDPGLWWILQRRWETHTFFYISDSCCSLTILTATCNFSSKMQQGWKKVNRWDVVHFSGTLCLHYANGGSVPVFHPRRVLRKEFWRWYSAKEFRAVRTCEKKRPKANLCCWVNAHNRGRTCHALQNAS